MQLKSNDNNSDGSIHVFRLDSIGALGFYHKCELCGLLTNMPVDLVKKKFKCVAWLGEALDGWISKQGDRSN